MPLPRLFLAHNPTPTVWCLRRLPRTLAVPAVDTDEVDRPSPFGPTRCSFERYPVRLPLFNPKANPRCVRLLGIYDTVEVWGSSPHGPTISFSELAYTTPARQAPNGSIKDACADLRDLIFPTTGLERSRYLEVSLEIGRVVLNAPVTGGTLELNQRRGPAGSSRSMPTVRFLPEGLQCHIHIGVM